MQFISTRGGMAPCGFTDVLLSGLAPDGGLVMPVEIPRLSTDDLEHMRSLSYAELAARIIGLYATDIPTADLATLTASAYSSELFPDDVVPLRHLDKLAPGLTLVGLSEGPTMAFKDLAMQFLGQAIPYVLTQRGEKLTIVGATSGDTGSAAEHAFRGKDGVSVFMLSPQGRMSAVQRAQMYSIADPNIHNIAVDGVFDDCQNLVKEVHGDIEFKQRYSIGAVNSINIGRIAAQIVYYVWAWLRISDRVEASARSSFVVDVCVPSGNFGNIYAGYLARAMGIPLHRLVVATNENNVLDEFFRTGRYAPRSSENTYATSSPSMDISRASNLERFIYQLLSPEAFVPAWKELERSGVLDLSELLPQLQAEKFISATSTHADRLNTIRQVYETTGTLIDPHTADGVGVALRIRNDGTPMLVMETALAAKFSDTVSEALGDAPAQSPEITELLAAPHYVTNIANDVMQLRELIEKANA